MSGNVEVTGRYFASGYTLADQQLGSLRVDANGVLLTTLLAGGGVVSGSYLSVDANGIQPTLSVSNFGTVFNGTTWDRQRGDTNGTVVQSGLSATFWNYASPTTGIVNTAVAVTIKATAGAAVRNYLKTLHLDHDALGVATEIAIRDGAAGTVLWRGKLQTAMNEGRVINFDPPLKGTANTLMEVITLTASVTGGVFVNATGFTGA